MEENMYWKGESERCIGNQNQRNLKLDISKRESTLHRQLKRKAFLDFYIRLFYHTNAYEDIRCTRKIIQTGQGRQTSNF